MSEEKLILNAISSIYDASVANTTWINALDDVAKSEVATKLLVSRPEKSRNQQFWGFDFEK